MIAAVGALVLALAASAVWRFSSWPAALLIRSVFARGARRTVAEMNEFAPTHELDERDVRFGLDSHERFTVVRPRGETSALPVVVWVHGGAWISGKSADVMPYARLLATERYAVVCMNYGIAPGTRYPVALEQLNDALGYLVEHSSVLGLDSTRIVIAGDSAGANLTSQLGLVTTNEPYARAIGIAPALDVEHLRGVILNCGIYDVSHVMATKGLAGWGFRAALRAYLASRTWASTVGARQMSTLDHVTSHFPRTWVSGGNADPLTDSQSRRLATRLAQLGVSVQTHFFAPDHEPALPHEYQFHLRFADARAALRSTTDWLDAVFNSGGSATEAVPGSGPDKASEAAARPSHS